MKKKDNWRGGIISGDEVYKPESKFDKIILDIFNHTLTKAKEKNLVITGDEDYPKKEVIRKQIYSKEGYINLIIRCRKLGLDNYYTARMEWGLTPQNKAIELMKFNVEPCYSYKSDLSSHYNIDFPVKRSNLIKEKDFRSILNRNLEFVLNLEK